MNGTAAGDLLGFRDFSTTRFQLLVEPHAFCRTDNPVRREVLMTDRIVRLAIGRGLADASRPLIG